MPSFNPHMMRKSPFMSLRRRAEDAAAGLPSLMAQAERAAAGILPGGHTRRRAGMGEKFWQFREYDPFDRPQDIDWRQSAKGDRIYVRQKEWQTTQTAMFWCQRDEAMAYSSHHDLPTKQETAIVMTLALASLLLRGGEQIGLVDGGMRAGRTEIALEKLGRHFFEAETGATPDNAAGVKKDSNVILAGDFLCHTEEIEAMMKVIGARAESVMMIQILDPAELSLPFEGRVIFEELPGNEQYNVEHVGSIRDAYIKRISHHLDEIKHLCRKHGWHWLLHSTDENIKDTLFDAWMMMAPESFHGGKGGAA